ncbi:MULTISPECIES: OmpA family protein [unclassified Thiocapsa]|uniref:OmpA family protein n=1 Tax=unclassified Thiocapsa TaxID=2641286 RepID=UPI0035B3A828
MSLTLGILLLSVGGPQASFSDRFALLQDWFGNRFGPFGNEASPDSIDAINSGDDGRLQGRLADAESSWPKDIDPRAESGFAGAAGAEPRASVGIPDLVDDDPPTSTFEEMTPAPQSLDPDDHGAIQTESVMTGDSGLPRFDGSNNGLPDPVAVPDDGRDTRQRDDFGNLDHREVSGEASSTIDPKPGVPASVDYGVPQRIPESPSGTEEQDVGGLPTSLKDEITDLGLTPIEADGGSLLNLRELVPFGFDSSEIPSDSIPLLDRLADILDRYQQVRIQVIGHTDDIGNADYNRQLSLSRATALVQYIAKRVHAPERFEAIGMGEDDPLISPGLSPMTPEQRLLNRRIEMRILPIQ